MEGEDMMRFLAAHKGNEGCEAGASLRREVPMNTRASKYGTVTKTLLACGVVAGPLYVVVGAIEAFTREGFDPHPPRSQPACQREVGVDPYLPPRDQRLSDCLGRGRDA